MRHLVLAVALVLLAIGYARAEDPTRSATRPTTEHIIDVATLTPAQAARLQGHRCVFRIQPHPARDIAEYYQEMACVCVHKGGPDLECWASLPPSPKIRPGATVIAEGTIRVYSPPRKEEHGGASY
jgi:hypothetical protein